MIVKGNVVIIIIYQYTLSYSFSATIDAGKQDIALFQPVYCTLI